MAIHHFVANDNSYTQQWDRNSYTGTMVFWSDDPLTDAASYPGYGDVHPLNSNLRCVRVTTRPYGKITGVPDILKDLTKFPYEGELVTAEYSNIILALNGTPLMEVKSSVRAFNCIGGRVWASDGTPVIMPDGSAMPISRKIPSMEITMYAYWGDNPLPNIVAAQGCVNDALWHGFAAGTVYFEGVKLTEVFDSTVVGGIAYRTVYSFIWSGVPWNQAWHANTATWDTAVPSSYATASFGLTLQV